MTVVAVVQARLSSSRLPRKVLATVAGRPLLDHVIRRSAAATTVDRVVVAAADEPGVEELAAVARSCGAGLFVGSADDVLARFVGAAHASDADVVVRITADDPFKDPAVVDLVTACLLDDPDADYASNTLHPTYPEGLDVEAVRVGALEAAARRARLPSEREHVTSYLWTRPDRFHLRSVEAPVDHSGLRLTVDYPDDLAFARAVYDALAPATLFGLDDILALLARRPDIAALAPTHPRNEGYLADRRRERAGGGLP